MRAQREEIEAKYGKLLSNHWSCKTTETHKYCSHCKRWRKHKHFNKEQQAKLAGLNPKCKDCKRPAIRKASLKKFGLTQSSYDALLKGQDYKCAICGSAETGTKRTNNFNVDHDHNTGEVRGLLCHGCNTGLGAFKDDPALMVRAIEYLRMSQQ